MIKYFFGLLFNSLKNSLFFPGLFASLFYLLLGLSIFTLSMHTYKQIWRTNHFYLQTICKIADKKSDCGHYQVSYRIDNQDYISIAKTHPLKNTCAQQTSLAEAFITGQEYYCWYDPDNRNMVLLDRGHAVFSLIFMGFSFALMLWIIYRNFLGAKKPLVIEKEKSKTYFTLDNGRKIPIEPIEEIVTTVAGPMIRSSRFFASMGLVAGIILLLSVPYQRFENSRVNRSYIPTTCTVLNKQLEQTADYYQAMLFVRYPVQELQYIVWTPVVMHAGVKGAQEKLLKRFEIGKSYPCWHDPRQPHTVMLAMRESRHGFLWVMIGLCLVFFGGMVRLYLSPAIWQKVKKNIKWE